MLIYENSSIENIATDTPSLSDSYQYHHHQHHQHQQHQHNQHHQHSHHHQHDQHQHKHHQHYFQVTDTLSLSHSYPVESLPLSPVMSPGDDQYFSFNFGNIWWQHCPVWWCQNSAMLQWCPNAPLLKAPIVSNTPMLMLIYVSLAGLMSPSELSRQGVVSPSILDRDQVENIDGISVTRKDAIFHFSNIPFK